jgi:hypothetical protein
VAVQRTRTSIQGLRRLEPQRSPRPKRGPAGGSSPRDSATWDSVSSEWYPLLCTRFHENTIGCPAYGGEATGQEVFPAGGAAAWLRLPSRRAPGIARAARASGASRAGEPHDARAKLGDRRARRSEHCLPLRAAAPRCAPGAERRPGCCRARGLRGHVGERLDDRRPVRLKAFGFRACSKHRRNVTFAPEEVTDGSLRRNRWSPSPESAERRPGYGSLQPHPGLVAAYRLSGDQLPAESSASSGASAESAAT